VTAGDKEAYVTTAGTFVGGSETARQMKEAMGKSAESKKEAVRQGVIDFLKLKGALQPEDTLKIEITNLTFQRDEAHATVSFEAPSTRTEGGMLIDYVLQRKGDRWVVTGRQDARANPR
jgi:hypothetical protein